MSESIAKAAGQLAPAPAEATQVAHDPRAKAAGRADGEFDDLVARVERALAGAGQPLPFASEIQASFEHHDISSIRAYIGGPAAELARDLGGVAFASGSKIAFAASPDLHAAAHEAAHVVQQRRGGPMRGIDGGASDAHEMHADRVADAVVAKLPAGRLLDRVGGSNPTTGVIQRKTSVATREPAVVAGEYFQRHEQRFLDRAQMELETTVFLTSPRFDWVGRGKEFTARFPAALRAESANGDIVVDLAAVLYPSSPWQVIDLYRSGLQGEPGGDNTVGPAAWSRAAGDALAIEIARRVRESIERMVPRFVAQLDREHPAAPKQTHLVPSTPMDWVVARLLVDPQVTHAKGRPGKATPADFAEGARWLTDFEWLGATDPKLWNWVEVRAPKDATREDVAFTLFAPATGADYEPAKHAHLITGGAPFFHVHPDAAERIPGVAKPDLSYADGSSRTVEDGEMALASSELATRAAIGQAADERRLDKRGKPVPHDYEQMKRLLAISHRQVARAFDGLVAWKLTYLVQPAKAWIEERIVNHRGGSEDLDGLHAVYEGQQAILFEAVGALIDLVRIAGPSVPTRGALREAVVAHAMAIGTSHLVDTARAYLAKGRQARADLTIGLLDESLRASAEGMDTLRLQHATAPSRFAAEEEAQYSDYQARILEMKATRAHGLSVPEADIELLTTEVHSHTLATRYETLEGKLRQLYWIGHGTKSTITGHLANLFSSSLDSAMSKLGDASTALGRALKDHKLTIAVEVGNIQAVPLSVEHKRAKAAVIRSQTAITELRLAEAIRKHELDETFSGSLFEQATSAIEDQQTRTLIVEIGALVAISVVSSGVGTLVAGAARGALLARSAVTSSGLLRGVSTARFAGAAAGISADAVTTTALTHAASGRGDGVIDNLAGNAAILVALRPLQKLMSSWNVAELDPQNVKVWTRYAHNGKLALKSTVTLTTEMLAAAAVGYAYERMKQSGKPVDEPMLESWALQGATMALGRFVSGRLAGFEARLSAMGEHAGQLRARSARLAQLARQVETKGDPDDARELLLTHHKLLDEERAVLEQISKLPPGIFDAQTLTTLKRGNHAELRTTDDRIYLSLTLKLNHLEPDDASGATWIGTRTDIATALHQAEQTGLQVAIEPHPRDAREWKVRVGTHELTMVERHERAGPARTARHAEREAGARAFVERRWEESWDGKAADPKATSLVQQVASGKGFAEQHAHAPGSVPVKAVLRMVEETDKTTPAERQEQIELLEALIAERTPGKSLQIRDLSTQTVDDSRRVSANRKLTIASIDGDVDLGLLNKMLVAKRKIVTETGDVEKQNKTKERFAEALEKYRKAIGMQKPDGSRYDAAIDTTYEFFVRYKMIVAHGLSTAEIAAHRASAEELGMQELRYGTSDLDTRRKELEARGMSREQSGVAALHDEAAHLVQHAPDGADVSSTLATTKNRIADRDPMENEQGLMVDFVKAWNDDATIKQAFNGMEAAGVEKASSPPGLLWEAAAQRTFRNAIAVRDHLAGELRSPADVQALTERIARGAGISVAKAEQLIARFRAAGYDAALAATEQRGATRALGSMPPVDARTKRVTEQFAGLSIEEVATETRMLADALRVWSAESGAQHGDVTLLGMTMHAGEQLLNEKMTPFELLDQVDQAVSIGVDRIGHGLVLVVDPQTLVNAGRLQKADLLQFKRRQQQVVDHVRAAGVVVESNLSSNTEISNLTQGQHPIGRFLAKGLKVTVNTDDETVLATTIQREFHRVSRAPGVTRNDLAATMLEAYRSRLGNRELQQRARIKPLLLEALLKDLTRQEAFALAAHLADRFHVLPADSPRNTVRRVLDTTLGL